MNIGDIVRVKKSINVSKALKLCTLFILDINEETGKANVIVIESKKCTVTIDEIRLITKHCATVIYNTNDICDFKFEIYIHCLENI
jgi:hypothetical protein